jgi:predicted permease
MTATFAEIWQDIRYSVRLAFQRPLFTLIVIGSLALGIGLSTSVFSFLNALFLRPLPGVSQPENLIYLASGGRIGTRQLPLSYLNYKDLRERNHSFSDLAAYQSIRVGLAAGHGEPEQIAGEVVTGDFFKVLGAAPALGRDFSLGEGEASGSHPEVVLGYGLWQRLFGADPRILGREILVNGQSFAVVGVARRGFKGMTSLSAAELWVPLTMAPVVLPVPKLFEARGNQALRVVGRLRPGVGPRAAAAEVRALAARLEQEYPKEDEGLEIALTPLVHPLSFKSGPLKAGAFLMVVMDFLLLIVCVNVANMLLVRAIARRRELAIRISLGASRGRLARQLIAEGLVLSLTGGACGLLAAAWSMGLLWRLRPPTLEAGAVGLALDGRVLAFSFATLLAASLIVSLLPALQTYRADLGGALRGEPGFVRVGEKKVSLSHGLVIFQVALCSLCLACAGLFLQGLYNLLRVDPGFDSAHLLSASFDLKAQGYGEARGRELQRRLLERAAALPGVEAAALSESRPLGGFRVWREAVPVGSAQDVTNAKKRNQVGSLIVSPGYFRTLRLPLEKGRDFTAADRAGAPQVAIVNRAMVRRFWPSADPLGTRVTLDDEAEPVEIVGVVGDSKVIELDEQPIPLVYLPLEQRYTARAALDVRAAGSPEPLLDDVRRALAEIAPALPVPELLTASEAIERSLWAPRAGAALLSLLGLLALLLAMFGVYGITAYSVAQRSREIGIRMALGARPAGLVGMLVQGGMAVLLIGLACGIGLAHLSEKWISKLVYGLQGGDSLVLLLIAVLLTGVGVLANAVPAVRVVRTNPAVDLRRGE